jgi:hypothetical protein
VARVHSQAFIKWNGRLLATKPSPTIDLGGVTRAPVMGNNRINGYSETPAPSTLECEISLSQGVSLKEIQDMVDATVTYEADTGQTYIMRGAFVTETVKVTGGADGGVTVRIAAEPAEEMLS